MSADIIILPVIRADRGAEEDRTVVVHLNAKRLAKVRVIAAQLGAPIEAVATSLIGQAIDRLDDRIVQQPKVSDNQSERLHLFSGRCLKFLRPQYRVKILVTACVRIESGMTVDRPGSFSPEGKAMSLQNQAAEFAFIKTRRVIVPVEVAGAENIQGVITGNRAELGMEPEYRLQWPACDAVTAGGFLKMHLANVTESALIAAQPPATITLAEADRKWQAAYRQGADDLREEQEQERVMRAAKRKRTTSRKRSRK